MNAVRTIALFSCIVVAVSACTQRNAGSEGAARFGDSSKGAVLIERYSCGACHTVPGIHSARGRVGPPLDFFSQRTFIAGRIPNTPANLARWIRHPQAIDPDTAMPDLGVEEGDARDIAAYLMTLR